MSGTVRLALILSFTPESPTLSLPLVVTLDLVVTPFRKVQILVNVAMIGVSGIRTDRERLRCEIRKPNRKSVSDCRSDSNGEQLVNELCLSDHIVLCQPSHSALVDHVHGFDSLQRPPGSSE